MADQELSIVIRARDLLTAELKRIEAALESFRELAEGTATSTGEQFTKTADAMHGVGAAAEDAGQSFGDIDASVDLTGAIDEVEQLGASFEQITPQAADAAANSADALSEIGTAAEEAADESGSAFEGLATRASDALGSVARAGATAFHAVQGAAEQLVGPVVHAFESIGEKVKELVTHPITEVIAAVAGFRALEGAVEEEAKFSEALGKVSAALGGSSDSAEEFKDSLAGIALRRSIDDVAAARAAYQALTGGARDSAEALRAVDAAAGLTRVSFASLESAEQAVLALTSAYRTENLSAERAADLLFATTRAGRVSLDTLGATLGNIAPLTKGLGITLEDLLATLAAITASGPNAQRAIFGLQSIIAQMGHLSEESEAKLASLGVSLDPVSIRAQGLGGTFAQLNAAIGKNPEVVESIFPGARTLGVLFSALEGSGENLSRALDQINNAAGGVARGELLRIQQPGARLADTFVHLKHALEDTFGATVLAGVDAFITKVGGVEKLEEVVRAFGATAGSVVANFISTIGEIGVALKDVDFRAFAAYGLTAIKLITAGFEGFAKTVKFVTDLLSGTGPALISINFDRGDLVEANKAIKETSALLDGLERDRTSGNVRLVSDEELAALRKATKDIPDVDVLIKPQMSEAGVRAVLARVESFKKDVDDALSGAGTAGFKKMIDDFGKSLEGPAGLVDQAFADLDKALAGVGGKPVEIEVRANLGKAQAEIDELRDHMEKLQLAAGDVVDFKGAGAIDDLKSLGAQAEHDRDALAEATEKAAGFREALREIVGEKITAKEDEIRKLESGLEDARSQAELLGIAGTEAGNQLGAAFQVDKIAAAQEQLAALRSELEGLSEETPTVVKEFAGLGDAARQSFGVSLKLGRTMADVFGEARAPTTALAIRFGVDAATMFARGWIEQTREKRRDLLEQFTTGPGQITIQLALIGVENATRVLAEIQRQREAISGTAIALGIKTDGLSLRQIEQAVDNARAIAERANLAITLGLDVKLDEKSINEAAEKAQLALDRASAEVSRASQEREAIRFGISLDSSNIEADLIKAHDEAQALSEQLSDRSEILLAVRLGFDPEDVSEARASVEEFQAFLRDHPLADNFAAGFGNAFADFITGAQSAKEAFGQFAVSFLRDAAAMFARQAALNALFAAFGGAGADTFTGFLGTPAAKGIVYGDEPGMAVRYAVGGVPSSLAPTGVPGAAPWSDPRGGPGGPVGALAYALGGTPDISRALWTAPVAYEAGGAPDLERALGTRVESYALGGAPDATRTLSTDVLHWGAGGAPDLHRRLWTRVEPYALGGFSEPGVFALAAGSIVREELPTREYRLGGSPHLDTIARRPTLERSEALAGMAIVPLSGGGVATTAGEHLPVTQQGRELVVHRYAQGGHLALFGEAGPEAVMRTYAAPGARLGLRDDRGDVLPFTRLGGGRLGVEAHRLGTVEPYSIGGLPAPVYRYATGGVPAQQSAGGVAVSVAVSVPVTVQHTAPQEERDLQRDIQTAIARSVDIREAIAAVVSAEVEKGTGFRGRMRGDRV